VSGKGSGRISVAGLVGAKPGSRIRLLYRIKVHRSRKGERRSFAETDYAALLDAAHQYLKAPIVLIWDNLNVHVSAVMRDLAASRDWLHVVQLPAYCPGLNPTEAAQRRCAARVRRGRQQRDEPGTTARRRQQLHPRTGLQPAGLAHRSHRSQGQDTVSTGWQPARRFDPVTRVHGLHYVGDKLGLLVRAAAWLTETGTFVADLDLTSIRLANGRPAGPRLATAMRRGASLTMRAATASPAHSRATSTCLPLPRRRRPGRPELHRSTRDLRQSLTDPGRP
jgi:hypothetical protein